MEVVTSLVEALGAYLQNADPDRRQAMVEAREDVIQWLKVSTR